MKPHLPRQLAWLPVSTAGVCSIYGLVLSHWDVADMFFWFWCEFVLAGITTFIFLLAWQRFETKLPRQVARMMPYLFGFSFVFILFYATLFTAVAYHGEWKDYGRLPEFLANKWISLAALVLSYAVLLISTLTKPDRGSGNSAALSKPFNRKCVVIVGFYCAFLIHGWIREWTTGAKLDLTPGYLRLMGIALLLLKTLAELGLFDFWRRKTDHPQTAPLAQATQKT